MRRPRVYTQSGIYHVTLRAINRQQIFGSPSDYRCFLSAMQHTVDTCLIQFHAYCLMGNHVHLLVEASGVNLSDSMKVLECTFVHRYNSNHGRCGPLFQGRFYSVPVESERKFLIVLRYIHQNPMRAGMEEKPGNYPWSSYHGYFHSRAKDILCRDRVLEYFPEAYQLQEFLAVPAKASETIQCRTPMRMDDTIVIPLICELAGCEDFTEAQSLPLQQRNQVICKLTRYRVPKHIVARFMGVSLTQLRRILKEEEKKNEG